jgi:hypothetical protein
MKMRTRTAKALFSAWALIDAMSEPRHSRIALKVKPIAQGDFKNIEDRKKSLTWVMQSDIVDAVAIGMKSREEIDEAIMHINNAFAV